MVQYNIGQSVTMPYKPFGESQCERFNHTLLDLLKTFPKEYTGNWPLYVPSLVLTYNAISHRIPGYEPYELIFWYKAPIVCDA